MLGIVVLLHHILLLAYSVFFFEGVSLTITQPTLRNVIKFKFLYSIILFFYCLSALVDGFGYLHFGLSEHLVLAHVIDLRVQNVQSYSNDGVGLTTLKPAVSVDLVHDVLSIVGQFLRVA
jgi:hypothetical protein